MLPGCNGMGSPAISAEPSTPDLGTDHGICLPPSGLQRQDEIRFGTTAGWYHTVLQHKAIWLEVVCVGIRNPPFPPTPILCE